MEEFQQTSEHLEPGHDIREVLERHVAEYQATWRLPWLTPSQTVQPGDPVNAPDGRYWRGKGPAEIESDDETISDVEMDSGEFEAEVTGEHSLPQTTRHLNQTTSSVRMPRLSKRERDLAREIARAHSQGSEGFLQNSSVAESSPQGNGMRAQHAARTHTSYLTKSIAVPFDRNSTGFQVQHSGLPLGSDLCASAYVNLNENNNPAAAPVNPLTQAPMPSSTTRLPDSGKATSMAAGQPRPPMGAASNPQPSSKKKQKKERKTPRAEKEERKQLKTEQEAAILSRGGPQAEALKAELAKKQAKKKEKKEARKQSRLEASGKAERSTNGEVRNPTESDTDKALTEAAKRKAEAEAEAYTDQVKLERIRRREELMALLDRGPDSDPHPWAGQAVGNGLQTRGLKQAVIHAAEDGGDLDEDDLP